MKLPVIEFPESTFTEGSNFLFVADASEMMDRHLQPFYDDACDVGFKVKRNDGTVVSYTLSSVRKNDDGEVTAWEYIGDDSSGALVFND